MPTHNRSPFGSIPQTLTRLALQKRDPRNELLEQRLATMQEDQFRQNLLTNFLTTADLSRFKGSEILSNVAAISGNASLIPNVINAQFKEEEIDRRQTLFEQEQERLADFTQRQQATLSAESEGGTVRTEREALTLTAQAPNAEQGRLVRGTGQLPEKPETPESPPGGFAGKFTGDSINTFLASGKNNASRDYTLLEFDPNFLSRVSSGDKAPLGTTLPEKARKKLAKEFKRRLQNHTFFKGGTDENGVEFEGIGDRGIFDTSGKSLKELARGENKEVEELLKNAPVEFTALLADYAKIEFRLDLVDKLFTRDQLNVPSRDLQPGTQSPQVQPTNLKSKSTQELFDMLRGN